MAPPPPPPPPRSFLNAWAVAIQFSQAICAFCQEVALTIHFEAVCLMSIEPLLSVLWSWLCVIELDPNGVCQGRLVESTVRLAMVPLSGISCLAILGCCLGIRVGDEERAGSHRRARTRYIYIHTVYTVRFVNLDPSFVPLLAMLTPTCPFFLSGNFARAKHKTRAHIFIYDLYTAAA